MKKFLLGLALVASLAFPAAASAHPATPTKAMDAYPCQNTQWDSYGSYTSFFQHEWLEATLWVYVDPDRTNAHGYPLFCGYVQSEGHDGLESGCITFIGSVDELNSPYGEFSSYNVYHCTLQAYDLLGSSYNIDCPSGQQLVAFAGVTQYTDAVDSPTYTC